METASFCEHKLEIKNYCPECNQLICDECMVSEHMNHPQLQYLETTFTLTLAHLKQINRKMQIKAKLLEKSAQFSLDEFKHLISIRMEESFQQIINHLINLKENALQQIFQGPRIQKVISQKNQAEEMLHSFNMKIMEINNFIEKIQISLTDEQYLKNSELLETNFKPQLEADVDKLLNRSHPNLDFKDYENLQININWEALTIPNLIALEFPSLDKNPKSSLSLARANMGKQLKTIRMDSPKLSKMMESFSSHQIDTIKMEIKFDPRLNLGNIKLDPSNHIASGTDYEPGIGFGCFKLIPEKTNIIQYKILSGNWFYLGVSFLQKPQEIIEDDFSHSLLEWSISREGQIFNRKKQMFKLSEPILENALISIVVDLKSNEIEFITKIGSKGKRFKLILKLAQKDMYPACCLLKGTEVEILSLLLI